MSTVTILGRLVWGLLPAKRERRAWARRAGLRLAWGAACAVIGLGIYGGTTLMFGSLAFGWSPGWQVGAVMFGAVFPLMAASHSIPPADPDDESAATVVLTSGHPVARTLAGIALTVCATVVWVGFLATVVIGPQGSGPDRWLGLPVTALVAFVVGGIASTAFLVRTAPEMIYSDPDDPHDYPPDMPY